MNPLEISVRFRDCDMLGHVNNAVYLNYFEQARIHYFAQLIGKEWDYVNQGLILVRNEITYLKPIFLNDKPIIYVNLVEIGTKSFTFGYKVMVDNELCTTGLSKLVCFDFKINQTVPVYPDFLEAFKKFEE